MGYDSAQERFNQATFKKLLTSHKIQYREIKHTDPDFTDYPDLVEEANYVSTLTRNNLDKKKWIIMGARDFKKMVMSLQTKKADQIKEYYISLEELFQMHYEYTVHFQKRQLQEQARVIEEQEEQNIELNDKVQTTNVKLDVARDVVVPPIEDKPSLMHWYAIVEMAPSFVPCESDPKYIQK